MAQIPYPSVTKPKPLGNPADKNYFSGSAFPVAPKAPAVGYVRPVQMDGISPVSATLPPPKVTITGPSTQTASPQVKLGSPSAVGFNPPYTPSTTPSFGEKIKSDLTKQVGVAAGTTLQQLADGGRSPLLGMAYNLLVPPEMQESLNNNSLRGTNLLNPNWKPKDWKDAFNTVSSAASTVAGGPITQALQGGMYLTAQLPDTNWRLDPKRLIRSGVGTGLTAITLGQVAGKYMRGDKVGAIVEFGKIAGTVGIGAAINQIWQKYGIDISPLQDLLSASIIKSGQKNAQAGELEFRKGAEFTNQLIQESGFAPYLKTKSADALKLNSDRKELTTYDLLQRENAAATGTGQKLRNLSTYLFSNPAAVAHAQPNNGTGAYAGYTPASLGTMSMKKGMGYLISPEAWFGIGAQEFDHLNDGMRGNFTLPNDYDDAFKYKGPQPATTAIGKLVEKFKNAIGYRSQKDYHTTGIEKTGWINEIIAQVKPKTQGILTDAEYAAAKNTRAYQTMASVLGIADEAALRRMIANHYDPTYFNQYDYRTRPKFYE